MSERSKMISKLINKRDARESYIRSKLSVLLPAQIRSLRLRREKTQAELGAEAEMKQARISALERIGDAGFSVGTLIRLAAAFGVGLIVKFVPMSEMLEWENSFQPDEFDVVPVEHDMAFIRPEIKPTPVSVSSISSPGTLFLRTGRPQAQVEMASVDASPIGLQEIPMVGPYVSQNFSSGMRYRSTAEVNG